MQLSTRRTAPLSCTLPEFVASPTTLKSRAVSHTPGLFYGPAAGVYLYRNHAGTFLDVK